MEIKRDFVKFNGRYHLLDLDDVAYLKKHGRWPLGYKAINWEKEAKNFVSLREFFGKRVEKSKAYRLAVLADYMGIPVLKRAIQNKEYSFINTFPKYWLEEMHDHPEISN